MANESIAMPLLLRRSLNMAAPGRHACFSLRFRVDMMWSSRKASSRQPRYRRRR